MSKIRSSCTALCLMAGALLWQSAYAEGAPPPSYATYFGYQHCMEKIGRCFDATVGRAPVTVIETEAAYKQLQAKFPPELRPRLTQVYWEVRQPVAGADALKVTARPNTFGQKELATVDAPPQVTVYPLDGQTVNSQSELVQSKDVFINGNAAVSQQNRLTQSYLPPGRYVFSIQYNGHTNFDRKWVFLTVK